MGFHRRKLFHPFRGSRNATMACRTNCSLIPSPLHSPVPPSLTLPRPSPLHDGYHMDQNYVLQIAMIAVASTLGVVTLLFTMSRILRYCYSRRYYLSRRTTPILFDIQGDPPFSDDEGPAIGHPIWFMPTLGLQQSAIDSITVCKYRKDEGLIEGTECLVCLGEFQEDEKLRLLPKCSHAFHVPCIDTWLRSHKNCPLCRAPVVHDTHTSDGSGGGGGNDDLELVRTTEPDLGFSGQNEDTQIENLGGAAESHHTGESESSEVRVVDDDSCILCSEDGGDNGIPDKILVNSDKMNCHSPIPIGSAVSAQEFEEEIQHMRRSVSVDSSCASMISRDVVDLNSDVESSDTDLDDHKKVSSSKGVAIAKQGSESSTTIYKLASIGHALHKRHFSLRSSSYNRKFIFSRLCRSQSSILPLSTGSMKEIYQPNLYVMPRSGKTIKD